MEFPPTSDIYSVYIESNILLKHVQIELDIQRDLDQAWLSQLKCRILHNHSKRGYFHFGVFEVACMNSDLFLINGQHRYYVLKDLQDQFGTFKVEVGKMLFDAGVKKKTNDPEYKPGLNTGSINLLRKSYVSTAFAAKSLSAIDRETLAFAMKHSPMTSPSYLREHGLKVAQEQKNGLEKITDDK